MNIPISNVKQLAFDNEHQNAVIGDGQFCTTGMNNDWPFFKIA